MTTDSNVYVFAKVKAKAGHEDELREALHRLVEIVRQEPGMIRYDLHEHQSEPGHFAFYETWEDLAALETHSATEDMKAHSLKAKGWVESSSVEVFSKID